MCQVLHYFRTKKGKLEELSIPQLYYLHGKQGYGVRSFVAKSEEGEEDWFVLFQKRDREGSHIIKVQEKKSNTQLKKKIHGKFTRTYVLSQNQHRDAH